MLRTSIKPPPSAGNTEPDQYFEPAELNLPVLKLLYSAGLRDEQRTLTGEALPIGREVDPDCGLVLPYDKQASAEHAVVYARSGGFFLVDRGSRNHTFINGQQIDECILSSGDIIRIGQSLLLFREEPSMPLDAPASERVAYETLRGTSVPIARLRHSLSRAARSLDSVLLRGATGTGKELSVQVLHELSGPPGRPLVRMNCAQLTASLAESQLFGHTNAAFTGARERKGLLREANGGTLFLDEIADLAPELQPMLLRVLEDGIVRPVGAHHAEVIKIKARFVAATNRDLEQLIRTERFREDLLARLATLPIELPRLRDRREDILPLFMNFLDRPERLLTGRLCEAILLYHWPQNVRELRSLANFANAMCLEETPLDLPALQQKLRKMDPIAPDLAVRAASAGFAPTVRHREVYTPELFERIIAKHHGVKKAAAAELGMSRRQLTRYLEKFNIDLHASALEADDAGGKP